MGAIDKTITIKVATVQINPPSLKTIAIGASIIFIVIGAGILISKSKK